MTPDADDVLAQLRAKVDQIQGGYPQDGHPQDGHSQGGGQTRDSRAAEGGPQRGRGLTDGDGEADAESLARTIVLRQLNTQARTRAELERILARKKVPSEAGRSVLDRLEEVGLIDDAAFAQAWVDSRQQRRHLSRSALRRELRAKGVDPEEVDSAVAEVDSDDEYAAAIDLARRKLRGMAGVDAVKVRRRLAGALARRGFGTGLSMRVIDEVTDES